MRLGAEMAGFLIVCAKRPSGGMGGATAPVERHSAFRTRRSLQSEAAPPMSDFCTMDERPGVELPPRDRLVQPPRGCSVRGDRGHRHRRRPARGRRRQDDALQDLRVEGSAGRGGPGRGRTTLARLVPAGFVDGPQAPRDKLDRIFRCCGSGSSRMTSTAACSSTPSASTTKSDPRLRDLALRHKSALLDAITALRRAAGRRSGVAVASGGFC